MKELTFKEIYNISDSELKTLHIIPGERSVLHITRFETPIGSMFGCAGTEGVSLLEFTDRKGLETQFTSLCRQMNAEICEGSNSHLEQLETEINEYFQGRRKVFSLSINPAGTEFRKSVWRNLMNIPYGKTRSYKQQAALLGNPRAVRAVASANGCNKIAIIIPCHRVIGSDGTLRGYAGGLHRKKYLLELEKNNLPIFE